MSMASSDNLESINDLEVENTLCKKFDEVSQDPYPQPSSPVLSRSLTSRKYLIGRRLKTKKSRVKLSDRFRQTEDQNLKSETTHSNSVELLDDSFSPSQNDDLIIQIEKLEELENKKLKIYNTLVSHGSKGDFSFKKPTSPSKNRIKKVKISEEIDNNIITNEHTEEKRVITSTSKDVPLKLPESVSFITATGKNITVLEADIKKCSKLFEDIISTNSQHCEHRKNKYTFLSKSKSNTSIANSFSKLDDKLSLSESDLSINKTSEIRKVAEIDFNGKVPVEGLKNVSENIVKSSEIPCKKEQMCGDKSSNKNNTRMDEQISLTQEIRESGISNTQIMCAVDEVLNSVELARNNTDRDFRGFDKKEIMEYENIFQNFVKVFMSVQDHRKSSRSIFSITQKNMAESESSQSNKLLYNKRSPEDLPLPPTKRIKSIDETKNIVENKENQRQSCINLNLGGFSSASGKLINIPEKFLQKAKGIFDDIQVDSSLPVKKSNEVKSVSQKGGLNNNTLGGFSSASGRIINVPDKYLQKAKRMFDDIDETLPLQDSNEVKHILQKDGLNNVALGGFTSASGKVIHVPEASLEKQRNILENIDRISPGKNEVKPEVRFLTLDVFNSNNAFGGFASASGKSISVSESSLKTAKNIFENLNVEDLLKSPCPADKTSASVSDQKAFGKVQILETITETIEDDFRTIKNDIRNSSLPQPTRKKNIFEDFDLTDIYDKFGSRTFGFQTGKNNLSKAPKKDPWKTPTVNGANQREKPIRVVKEAVPMIREDAKQKKRLGISSCKLLPISNNKLEKARLIFDEDFSKLSPVRPKQNNVYMSTPIRQNTSSTPGKFDLKAASVAGNSCNTPIRNDIQKPSRSFNSFLEGIAITPIKHDATEEERTIENPPIIDCHVDIVMKSPTRGNAEEWLRRLQEDRKKLEDRLSIVIERQKAMENLGRKKSAVDTRPRKGVLYLRKTSGNKVPLGCFVNNKKPGDEYVDFGLLDINPLNSEYVHFKDQSYAVLNTEDGATVVPNLNDIVGVSEIEMAFMAMPGVEPPLIPCGWIRNHYKWIVWKLACYERMFPSQFRGCLNVENVVQQLKYRYDREIDRAERSALRRIYEKDDAPQKRLVLCVSGIRKDNMGQLELELTDGWYRIRTVIDEPLRNQVSREKIQLGTKLIISRADLLNCDGCHPLEATELTCLKINFNSTRRTHWDTKLGYQHNPQPFPIPIHCVHPLGGPVGAIKICIVRTYPFKYLEKCEDCSVWRNRKAEERRAQQWEYDRCKKLERIRENVQNEYENSRAKPGVHTRRRHQNINNITCPKTICEILESSDDPDSLQKNLSSSQRAAIKDYWENATLRKQRTIEERINEDISKLRLTKRDVSAVLKLLVVDVNGSSDRGFSFSVWRPGETLLHVLKEGAVLTVQNVLPQKNGDISSCAKTIFKPGSSAPHLYNDFKRRLTHIANLTESNFSPTFNEFDTVGLVIQSRVEDARQEVWLSDKDGRLLLVNVYEGPSTCLLLDSVKRGEPTTVCNLVYREPSDHIARAVANHYTVFSSYSRHKHLQEGLEMFKKWLPKDTGALLDVCDSKIESFSVISSKSVKTYASFEETDDDTTLMSSRLTSTDVALSLLDVDQFT